MFSSRLPDELAPNRVARRIEQMRTAGDGIFDLTLSNPTRAGIEYPPGLLEALADPRGAVYEPAPLGLPEARRAVADDFRRRGLYVSPDRIVLTASTSEAYAALFKLLCDPGDRVLAPRPSYPLVEYLARLEGVGVEAYDLEYHGVWSVDPAAVAAAVTGATRAVLAVSPNNPTGSYLKRTELAALARTAAERGVALLGDEVFFEYPLGGGADEAASVVEQSEALAFSLGGLSKAAGLPQMKLAWMAVSGPTDLVERALQRLEVICDTYLSVGTPVQHAAGKLLAEAGVVRDRIAGRVRGNLQELERLVADHPAVRLPAVEGGWYAVLQVPAREPEERIVLELLERDHVLVHPGYFFDFPREAFLVVSLLPAPPEFAEAAGRLLARVAT